jgi:hypothetical protein
MFIVLHTFDFGVQRTLKFELFDKTCGILIFIRTIDLETQATLRNSPSIF